MRKTPKASPETGRSPPGLCLHSIMVVILALPPTPAAAVTRSGTTGYPDSPDPLK